MELMVIENNPVKAIQYEECGVDRIFIDLEILGKEERQGHLNTVISRHSMSDVAPVKLVLKKTQLLVRVNPMNPNSKKEIDDAIIFGADVLMLPMFKTKEEVQLFIKLVNKKVKVNLLLETPEAAMIIDDILKIPGIDEIHIGLNDLFIALGLELMMEMYLGSFLENLTSKIRKANISLGIGGIAPLDGGVVSGKLIAGEAIRLGCERFILSRAFPKNDFISFHLNILNLKKYCDVVKSWTPLEFETNRQVLKIEILKNKRLNL